MDSAASSQPSDSGPEGSGISLVSQKKPVQGKDFQSTLSTDFLGEEGVTTHEQTNLLAEHLWTGLGHWKPHSVHSITVFCNFKSVMLPSTEVSPLIPIPIIDTSFPRAAQFTWWPNGSLTLHGRQSRAAWQTTQIFCCTLALQRTLQRLGSSFPCLAS